MPLAMSEGTFLDFYKTTVTGYSKALQQQLCDYMEKKHIITFEKQNSLSDTEDTCYFHEKHDFEGIFNEICSQEKFANVFEYWEFVKLYKYSIPLFYEGDIKDILKQKHDFIEFVPEKFKVDNTSIATTISESQAFVYYEGDSVLIKFVIQKSYISNSGFVERTDYRYPIIIYFDTKNHIVEIRYDSFKYTSIADQANYLANFKYCINWLKMELGLKLYICDSTNLIDNIRLDTSGEVKIFKQMMKLSSGGSAELTAARDQDYIIPFIGELRELMEENSHLFDEAQEIRELLITYLDNLEDTANYPYVYVTWLKPVASDSFTVRFTFDYFEGKFIQLQHLTGCRTLRMERMNDAIEYLCGGASFTQGSEI